MKNRIVKKILRIILLVLVGAAVIGTFYFLWKKAQPVITVYEIVTPEKGDVETKTVATGNVEPRFEVEIKPQISGIISELKKEAGQMVQAGEIIAIIKVIPEMVQLNSAESRVNLANISLKQVAQCDGLRVEPQVTLAGLPQRPVDRLANEISGVGGSGFDQIEKRDEFFIAAFFVSDGQRGDQRDTFSGFWDSFGSQRDVFVVVADIRAETSCRYRNDFSFVFSEVTGQFKEF